MYQCVCQLVSGGTGGGCCMRCDTDLISLLVYERSPDEGMVVMYVMFLVHNTIIDTICDGE